MYITAVQSQLNLSSGFNRSQLQTGLWRSSYPTMFVFLVVALLCASCWADADFYSFSKPVGSGSGNSFSQSGDGPITAVRLWEIGNAYTVGIQFRFGDIWAPMIGKKIGPPHELLLFKGESIIQVSGKYHPSHYIYQLTFGTTKGRSLTIGQPTQISFHMYPIYEGAELIILSGSFNGRGITSVAAHWGKHSMDYRNHTKGTV